MSTLENTTIVVSAPKGVIPDLAQPGGTLPQTPELLNRIGQFFQQAAGSMAPGLPGETFVHVRKGSTNATPKRAFAKVVFATCPAGVVLEINGVPFVSVNGGQDPNLQQFDMSGTDASDATTLVSTIRAQTTLALIAGVVRAGNKTATITLVGLSAGDYVEFNGDAIGLGKRRFTATAYPTGRIGEFSVLGTDTQDATALAAAINADPQLNRHILAESAAGVVTVYHYTHTSSSATYGLTKSGAGITLGGLSSGKLADGATVIVSSLLEGVAGNMFTLINKGVVASGTVTYSGSSGAQTVLINGVTVYNATGASDSANAIAAAAAINASVNALVQPFVRAQVSGGVVTIYSKLSGAVGNSITLSVTGTGAVASVARLAGGTGASSDGVQASGTSTITGGSGAEAAVINGVSISVTWATSDNNTAILLRDAINASASPLVQGIVTASAAANVVTITAVKGGVAGNAITLSVTGTGNVASGARLAGGAVPTTLVPSADRMASGVGGDSPSQAKTYQW